MSYLNMPAFQVEDSMKGTISLWFRVSSDSITKATQHGEDYPYDPLKNTVLRGVIPLVTFGRQLTGDIWDSQHRIDCVSEVNPVDGRQAIAGSFHPTSPVTSPMEPSHIGISCFEYFGMPSPSGAPPPSVTLKIVLQTPQQATAAGLYNDRVECHFGPLVGGAGTTPWLYETVAEASYIRTSWPEAFTIAPNFEVTTDEWHHLLASWNLSTSVDTVATEIEDGPNVEYDTGKNVQGACQFYFAYDDENKTGQESMGRAWAYKGLNDVVPDGAFQADFNYSKSTATDNLGVPLVSGNVDAVPQWHWAATPLALNGGHVGAPAGAEHVDNVYHVEMAELQFFVDYTVDTADENIRRAFVDNDGEPVPPKDTEKLLGRRPDILLHGSSNWKKGKNTGSVGLTRVPEGEDTIIDTGQFVPVALIRPYKPDPKLEEAGTA